MFRRGTPAASLLSPPEPPLAVFFFFFFQAPSPSHPLLVRLPACLDPRHHATVRLQVSYSDRHACRRLHVADSTLTLPLLFALFSRSFFQLSLFPLLGTLASRAPSTRPCPYFILARCPALATIICRPSLAACSLHLFFVSNRTPPTMYAPCSPLHPSSHPAPLVRHLPSPQPHSLPRPYALHRSLQPRYYFALVRYGYEDASRCGAKQNKVGR